MPNLLTSPSGDPVLNTQCTSANEDFVYLDPKPDLALLARYGRGLGCATVHGTQWFGDVVGSEEGRREPLMSQLYNTPATYWYVAGPTRVGKTALFKRGCTNACLTNIPYRRKPLAFMVDATATMQSSAARLAHREEPRNV